ncbi:SPOR domain-containing protein [Candidatus Latescibacterota bacterium]
MKKSKIFEIIAVNFTVVFLIGCGAAGLMPSSIYIGSDVEDLNPFDFGDEFTQVEQKKSSTQSQQNNENVNKDHFRSIPDNVNNKTNVNHDVASSSDVVEYRIQIDFFDNKDSANRMANRARSRIDLAVDVVYEPPFYRIRAGNFKDRKEAEQYVNILKDKGFKDSRIIRNITTY